MNLVTFNLPNDDEETQCAVEISMGSWIEEIRKKNINAWKAKQKYRLNENDKTLVTYPLKHARDVAYIKSWSMLTGMCELCST